MHVPLTTSQAADVRRDAVLGRRPTAGDAVDLAPADAGLLERLRAWRSAQAQTQGVPAYVIFHDRTLAQVAARRPRDVVALSMIDGVGAKKLERYGPAILQLLSEDTEPVDSGEA